jgi:uncharacterized RDD family membrane protein YckC
MKWYYAEAGQQKGPVDEQELSRLFQAGGIQKETLVWHEGLASWEPYSKYQGAAGAASAEAGGASAGAPMDGGVVCAECGKMFSKDNVIRYGDVSVCAGCKPVFVQRLKEGAAMPGALEYAGFGTRFGGKILDNIITRLIGYAIGAALGSGADADSAAGLAMAIGLGFGMEIAYRTIFVGAFGATPGKMAVKIRVVTADGGKVGYGRAFARAVAEYLSLMILFIGYLMAAWDSEKRSLHDRICGTRVIKN